MLSERQPASHPSFSRCPSGPVGLSVAYLQKGVQPGIELYQVFNIHLHLNRSGSFVECFFPVCERTIDAALEIHHKCPTRTLDSQAARQARRVGETHTIAPRATTPSSPATPNYARCPQRPRHCLWLDPTYVTAASFVLSVLSGEREEAPTRRSYEAM